MESPNWSSDPNFKPNLEPWNTPVNVLDNNAEEQIKELAEISEGLITEVVK